MYALSHRKQFLTRRNIMVDPKHLATINLSHGSTAKPLRDIAFSQLILKALYLSKSSLELNEICLHVAQLIGIRGIARDQIQLGIDLLNDRSIVFRNGKWSLTDESRKEIEKEISSADQNIARICSKYFDFKIPNANVRAWFDEAAANIFGHFSDEWVKSICKTNKHYLGNTVSIENLLKPSIEKHKLTEYQDSLVNGFMEFISSEDFNDQLYLMDVGLAMFASRLVTAGIGVDPIAIDELSNSKFIIDTNFIFALQLGRHGLSNSLKALGEALKDINAEIIYLEETKEEYRKTLSWNRNQVIELFQNYPITIIEKADNDFISAAKHLKCRTKEDYERFFDNLKDIPQELPGGTKINIYNNQEVIQESEKGRKDVRLQNLIQSEWLSLNSTKPRRSRETREPKGEGTLQHDAILIYVARFLIKHKEKCWIISLDRNLYNCLIKNYGNSERIFILGIDVLIQILAVNNAGPKQDINNFAPLLSSIIRNKCIPDRSSFSIKDLHWLNQINERISDLPEERIEKFLKYVAKARIEGKIDDRETELQISRMFQEEKLDYRNEIETLRERARLAEENTKAEKEKRKEAENDLKILIGKEELSKTIKRLARVVIFRILVVALIVLVILYISHNFIPVSNKFDYFLAVILWLTGVISWCWKPVISLFQQIKKSININD